MIQIEIETMKAAVSELQSKRAILSQIKERMAKLSYAISPQSYVEELVWELNKLDMRMEEIEENIRALKSALEEICNLVEATEKKVVACYAEEQQKPLQTKFVLGYQEKIWLNPHVKELTPIRLKSEGEADE